MTTMLLRRLAFAAFALLAFAAMAAAQIPSDSILNALEVRQLAAKDTVEAHGRLGAHFAALADQYAAEAKSAAAVAGTMAGNRNRRFVSPGTGWTRFAEFNTKAAVTLRELARHHEALAFGLSSIAPAGSARFENGAGAPEPTEQELAVASAIARTPMEHAVLAEYFLATADRQTAIADRHATMAAGMRANPNTRGADPAVHCDRIVKEARAAADKARREAAGHTRFATFA